MFLRNGKNIFKIRNSILLIFTVLYFSSCNTDEKKINLDGRWWFTFDVSKSREGGLDCDFGRLAYVEMFIYKKEDRYILNYIYENGFKSANYDWQIHPDAVGNKYVMTTFSNEECGYLEIGRDNAVFLKDDCFLIGNKIKFYPINNDFDHDYWNFFGNREKWNEEFICRETVHLKEVVLGTFK